MFVRIRTRSKILSCPVNFGISIILTENDNFHLITFVEMFASSDSVFPLYNTKLAVQTRISAPRKIFRWWGGGEMHVCTKTALQVIYAKLSIVLYCYK